MNSVLHVSQKDFSSVVLQSPVPVLVDFYADWCGPCRMLAPTLDRLAAEFAGRARIVKINIDHDPELAERFQVSAIPTLAFVAGGEIVGQTTGLVPEAALRRALTELIGAAAGSDRRAG